MDKVIGHVSRSRPFALVLGVLVALSLACQAIVGGSPSPSPPPEPTATPRATPTALPPPPVRPDADHPDEPVAITGEIPFTSPFFLDTTAEPFVMLEDQAGFVQRDREFVFSLESQVIGPVEFIDDQTLRYSLSLPIVPQGTFVDVDNDAEDDAGVQVFAVAYWSNTWGDPFIEPRDGEGWSNAYASTLTDPDRDNEIVGGTLVVWAADDDQAFPSGFGEDGLLFTEDDPAASIPAGYSLVELDSEPFRVFKEPQPRIDLVEGEVAVNDYSERSFVDAFAAMFEKASQEYPFTEEKDVDWEALWDQFQPRVADAETPEGFYRAIRDFTYEIPDGHVGVSFNGPVFLEEQGGGFGLLVAELSDGQVIATHVLPETPAMAAGLEPGAEILEWNGQPVSEAIDSVQPFFGPYSTDHHRRLDQVLFLTRVPPGTEVDVTFRNPGDSAEEEVTMTAEPELETFFLSLPNLNLDELALPVEGEVLDDSGLGYIQITTFSEDYNMMARLWQKHVESLIDNEIPGLVIDLRTNGGGSSGLSLDFAGYFFEDPLTLYRRTYYNERTDSFEPQGLPSEVEPGPLFYDGPLAVLVSPNCVSACEGFAYALQQTGRAVLVGHYPTAGAFGEVGRGQYELPAELSMQFPTGRPENLDGELIIEGVGLEPDVLVPVTEGSALGLEDAVLEAAVAALLETLE